jgi:CDGSH iron-sulfur domain-containing protein 3
MKNIDITDKESVTIDVKKGENYWCCTCGKSKTQPFCDGSHKGSRCKPFKYEATKDTTERFCAGKETCDKSCSMLNTANLD